MKVTCLLVCVQVHLYSKKSSVLENVPQRLPEGQGNVFLVYPVSYGSTDDPI